MIVLSNREPVRFQQGERAYLFTPPSVYGQAALRRAIAAAGATWYSEASLLSVLKGGLARLLAQPGDAARRDDYVALVDGFAARTLDAAGLERLGAVERMVTAGDGIYAQAVADRAFFVEVAPIEAFRLFCAGWEGPGLPAFARRADGLAAGLLEAIPRGELTAAGDFALGLTMLSGAEEKN